jgi:hypothetical protein
VIIAFDVLVKRRAIAPKKGVVIRWQDEIQRFRRIGGERGQAKEQRTYPVAHLHFRVDKGFDRICNVC